MIQFYYKTRQRLKGITWKNTQRNFQEFQRNAFIIAVLQKNEV